MWHAGYVTEIDYIHGYYAEMSPPRQRLAITTAEVPPYLGQPLQVLELGFGHGHSVVLHAATNLGSFWGTDFNASQTASAQSLAKSSGADIHLFDASFEEFAAREDLPGFDIINLHGIWTWISRENQAIIVEIARRKLKPGGLLYISYNVTPGWAPAMPLRHLMKQHADRASAGPLLQKLDGAIAFAQSLAEAKAGYFAANPAVAKRLEKIKEQNKHYVAHEYLNDSWDVMPFSEVADHLADAKLSYACSAHLLDQVDAINLSAEMQKLLKEIADPILRETVRDYCVNQQFRRDIFIKGPRKLAPLEQARALRAQPFALLIQPEDRPEKVTGSLGEADLNADVYQPIVEALGADGFRAKTINELLEDERCKGITYQQMVQALTILCGMGSAAPAHDEKTARAVTKTSRNLNSEICRRAEFSSDIQHIAAPLIGAGVSANRFEQLFLRAGELKHKDPPHYVWDLLKMQGQKLVKDGKAIESEEENLAELRTRYETFTTKRLPIFKRLGIV